MKIGKLNSVKFYLNRILGGYLKGSTSIYGKNNVVSIDKSVRYSNLRIVIKGSDNFISIGSHCLFMGYTCIYIEGDGNSVTIGSNLIAQPNLTLVLAEGTQVNIQDECLFAEI